MSIGDIGKPFPQPPQYREPRAVASATKCRSRFRFRLLGIIALPWYLIPTEPPEKLTAQPSTSQVEFLSRLNAPCFASLRSLARFRVDLQSCSCPRWTNF